MREITRSAEKRVRALEEAAREQFESSILHNRVSVAVHEDDRLRETLDVVERAYQLHDRADMPDEMEYVAFNAAEDINDHYGLLVDMAVARECATLIEDARGDWFDDADDQDAVDGAVAEASIWLAEHRDAAAAESIDVDEVVPNDEADEAFDPADYDDVREALLAAPNGYGIERILDYFDPMVDDEEVTPNV
ncbi:hypothetical protein DVK05_09740 [Halorubrum sp. Atlit-8R]|uniref:hypothetical protein n=1 Tax=Halorubrum sp. Atlit-8R TaxID=2282126 RepID=UPI000EF20B08|nr:hypothetical protein [Halorubrum sp. Atlit-8R]RLM81269.1 hypothetical protein DVK05_09740 [Halorubrum sp. Atlit-8R]